MKIDFKERLLAARYKYRYWREAGRIDSDAMLQALSRKRLIFTVTNGRSGSNLLQSYLACLDGVHAAHEDRPAFHTHLREVQRHPELAEKFLVHIKFPAILQTEEPVYVETSHLFCKGYFETSLRLGIVPDLILLRRDKRQTAQSLHRLNSIPGRNWRGKTFYLSPADPVYCPLPDWRRLNDYQLCYWHTLEIEQRMKVYRPLAEAHGGHVVDIQLPELAAPGGIEQLCAELGLDISPAAAQRLQALAGTKVNLKQSKRRDSSSADAAMDPARLEAWEAEVEHLIMPSDTLQG